MKIVIPGGSGHIGSFLRPYLEGLGHEVVVVGRRTAGSWAREIDGADAVINLAGRSVSCRYTPANLQEMMDSRIDSTRAVGAAIAAAARPPRVWLQMSTATIYAHTFGPAHTEDGVIGGYEPGVPAYWKYSIDIATAWEAEQTKADTPHTRKAALRTAIVMSPEPGGAFDLLRRMAAYGLGGPIAGGRQYMSWIHGTDLARAVTYLLENDVSGPVNLAAPNPLPQRDFVRTLRHSVGMPIGLPATKWMAELGAFVLRSDTELLLKSRRVVPGRLLEAGFTFDFPDWPAAAADLVSAHRRRFVATSNRRSCVSFSG